MSSSMRTEYRCCQFEASNYDVVRTWVQISWPAYFRISLPPAECPHWVSRVPPGGWSFADVTPNFASSHVLLSSLHASSSVETGGGRPRPTPVPSVHSAFADVESEADPSTIPRSYGCRGSATVLSTTDFMPLKVISAGLSFTLVTLLVTFNYHALPPSCPLGRQPKLVHRGVNRNS